jgi:hypothetical protein
MAVADGGKHDEPQRDDAIDRAENDDGEAKTRLGLDVAVDVGAVQQGAQHALPAGLGRFVGGGHAYRAPCFGMLPVASRADGPIMAPIGSWIGG